MKFTLFKLVVGTALVLGPVQAMYDDQEEDKEALSQTKVLQQNTSRKETSASISLKEDVSFEILPDEFFVSIFSFLDVSDLGRIAQASTRLKKLIENPELWRYMGTKYYGDYLSEEGLKENPKQKVISHYLSVIMNTKTDLQEIEGLVSHYRLDLYVLPFKKHVDLSIFGQLIWASSYKFLIVLGHQDALLNHISYHDCDRDWAVAASESLVEKGNQKAIERKIKKLIHKHYHYPTQLMMTDSPDYTKDIVEARQLNELLVEKGDPKAIGRKICGLSQGGDVNPFYVNPWYYGEAPFDYQSDLHIQSYGYERDPTAAKELNEFLVEKGDSDAIVTKIAGLAEGAWGYKKDPAVAIELNELLVEKCDSKAIRRKIAGLAEGTWGYKKDPAAAIELNEFFVTRSDLEAIKRKIEALAKGGNSYRKDPIAARDFVENLIISGIPHVRAIGKYIKAFAMKYGTEDLGYEKESEKAIEFIKHNHVPY